MRLILFLAFCVLPVSVFGYDFTDYTEVDASSKITVTADIVSGILPRNVDAYLYKDFGIDAIESTFRIDFTIQAPDLSGALANTTSGGLGGYLVLTNTLDDLSGQWIAGDDSIILSGYYDGDSYNLTFREVAAGTGTVDVSIDLPPSNLDTATPVYYYITILGNGADLTCTIYSDEARTTVVDTLSVTRTGAVKFRYLMPICSLNSSSAQTFYTHTQELDTDNIYKKVIGTSSYSAALSFPPQSKIVYDGLNYKFLFYSGSGSSTNFRLKSSFSNLKTDWDIETFPYDSTPIPNLTKGYNYDVFQGFKQTYDFTYYFILDQISTVKKVGALLLDPIGDTMTEKGGDFEAEVTFAGVDRWPSILIDYHDYLWLAGSGDVGADIKAMRATGPYSATGFATPVTLRDTTGTGMAQLIGFNGGDVGAGYSEDSGLYYKHYTSVDETSGSFGSEETVAATLEGMQHFKFNACRDGRVIAVYRTATNTLSSRIRDTSGTWGDEVDYTTDLLATSNGSGFTSTADVGKDCAAVVGYIEATDGPDINYVIHDADSGISAETTLVDNASLNGSYITSPDSDPERVPIVYHTSANELKLAGIVKLTPTQDYSGGNLFIGGLGVANQATQSSTQVVTVGDYTLYGYVGRDHRFHARLRNTALQSWVTEEVVVSKQYPDLHDEMMFYLADDYVYMALGGRNPSAETEPIVIYKSDYTLDSTSFTLDLANDWSDISPPSTAGRGYKRLVVDSSGVVYLLFAEYAGNGDKYEIMEYRAATWSTPVTFLDVNYDYDGGGDDAVHAYWTDVKMGNEPTGQQSIHMPWTFRSDEEQPEVSGGSVLQRAVYYVNILPNGDGTFALRKADRTTAIASPVDYDTADVVYEAPASYYWRVGGGVEVLPDGSPIFTVNRCANTSPYQIDQTTVWYWDIGTSAWVAVAVQNEDFPWHYQPKMTYVGTRLYIAAQKEYAGISEIVSYQSNDDGVTWSTAVRQTLGSNFDQYSPLISPSNAIEPNITWHSRLDRKYSEVITKLFTPNAARLWNGSMATKWNGTTVLKINGIE
jgi:hypothetical protein